MDPKKQDLTPELKQIYDRVMNTQVKNPPTASTPTTPPIPEATPTAAPTPVMPPVAPTTPNTTLGALDANKPAEASNGATHDTFLSSAPPRPLNDDKTFVFTGNKVTTPTATTTTPTPAHTAAPGDKKKISPAIMGVAVVGGVVVWGLVWAKIFGLI